MTKLSVVIADDDHLMLKNLKKLVNWDNLGFKVIATAANGKAALQYLRKYRPQILITDIIMPIMNGLELIEQVREEFPETKILIISSYDEFEYAKKAIAKGVTDYILKTEVTAASFTAKLSSLHQSCTSQNRILSTALNQEFSNFLDNNPRYTEYDTEINYPLLSRYLNKRYHFFIIMQQIGFYRHIQTALSNYNDASKSIYSALRSMEELSTAPIMFPHRHFTVVGISVESDHTNETFIINSLRKKILLYLNRRFPHKCMLFYSNALITPIDLHHFYNRVNYLIDFHASFHIAPALSFHELENEIMENAMDDFPFQKLSVEREHLDSDIFRIKEYLTRCYKLRNYQAILKFFQNFCTHMEIISHNTQHFDEQYLIPSLEFLLKWVFNHYEQCINQLSDNQTREYCLPVETAIHYMQQNYSNYALSAEDISAQASLSPGRLGVLFKQDTGKTINEYLTDMRIRNAIYFLSNTTMKIYEISDKCGYKSSQYFSQIFYQRTGKRPIDYRKIHH